MFYPELSPAMRWHLDQGQKMYNMQMFSHQFSDKFSDQYGKWKANNVKVDCCIFKYRVEWVILLMTWLLVFKRVITV